MSARCEQFRYDLDQKESVSEMAARVMTERHLRALAVRDEQLAEL